jgi:hypothetical protein
MASSNLKLVRQVLERDGTGSGISQLNFSLPFDFSLNL